MATSSTFSYAQAAKGQAASTSSTATATQSTSVVNGHPATSKNTSSEQDGFEASAIKGEVSELTSKPTESSNEATEPQEGVSSNAGPTGTDPRSSSVSLAGSRRDDDDAATESSTRRSEKGAARSPSSSTRVTDDADAKKGQRKGRKGKNGDTEKKSKEAEKEKEKEKELPKVELFEAPIPSVNIWAQRQEAQAAKVKTSPTPIRADASAPNAAEPEPKKKTKAETVAPTSVQYGATNGVRPPKTDADANVKRSAPRGSRVTDKTGALPPVGDSASWPTPETAIKEDKTKPSEKSEKTEAQEDTGANKTRRREWERIDFVPTVNWETPIPATRGSRGGRSGPGTRGGREATSRPSHGGTPAQTTEKSAETTNVPAKTNGEHRERTREGGAHRANSLPPATAKASTTDARNDQRKPGASKVPKTRDNGPTPSAEPLASRGEGRGERSRGGFHRGRGGGHTAGNASAHNQQNFMANGNAFSSQAGGPRGGHYMSPPLSQGNAFPGYGSAPGRGGRGGNRGQAGGFGSRGNGHNGGSRPRPISTVSNFPPFQWDPAYAGMPMTAPPYAPQQFNFEVKAILTQQVEYYFSLDNLCKDQHLRSFMDGQGFVTLSLIRNFHRVNKLCGDNLALLRAACAEMTLVDLCMSPDGVERLRSRQHPHAFILPVEQRQESARNPGPESYFICNNDQYQHQMQMGMVGVPFGPGAGAPYMNGVGFDDGSAHINGSQSSDGNGQLSAAVPEFQPAGLNGSTSDQHEKSVPEAVVTNGVAHNTEPAAQTLVNGTHSEPQTTETLQS